MRLNKFKSMSVIQLFLIGLDFSLTAFAAVFPVFGYGDSFNLRVEIKLLFVGCVTGLVGVGGGFLKKRFEFLV